MIIFPTDFIIVTLPCQETNTYNNDNNRRSTDSTHNRVYGMSQALQNKDNIHAPCNIRTLINTNVTLTFPLGALYKPNGTIFEHIEDAKESLDNYHVTVCY